MTEQEIRAVVEQMVRRAMAQPSAPAEETRRSEPSEGCLEDITEINLRKLYLVEHPQDPQAFQDLKLRTPARIGVGRAGARYKTLTMLRMRADHAAAQDSVFSDVAEEFSQKHDFVPVQTLCQSKDEYLTRPDLGRRFGPEAQEIIKNTIGRGTQVALVVGDGLSSAAIEANAADCVLSIRQGLDSMGISSSRPLFVKYCRVGASDQIGELTGAEIVCMLVGERPGLVTAESMSLYITYGAHVGIPESKRTVISNIHKEGTLAVEAGAHGAELIQKMLAQKTSGIELKQ